MHNKESQKPGKTLVLDDKGGQWGLARSPMNEIAYSPARVAHQTIGRYCQLMSIPEVSDLQPGMDFRLPQHRREVFLRFYQFHLQYASHPGAVYYVFPFLAQKYGWGREDKLWFAYINGNTQNPVTSYLIFKRFPAEPPTSKAL